MFHVSLTFFWHFQVSSGSSNSEQANSVPSNSSLLSASSATGFNKRKTFNDLRSDVDSVLTQMDSVLTQIPSMAANQSEVLSQLRLLTDLVVGQQAGLNGLRAELEKKSMTGNDSKQQSPNTDREKKKLVTS